MAVFVLGIAEHTIEKGEPKLPLVVNDMLTTVWLTHAQGRIVAHP